MHVAIIYLVMDQQNGFKFNKNNNYKLCYFIELINFTQPVYVWREDPNSRQNTIKEIIDRATSDQDWPQVIF